MDSGTLLMHNYCNKVMPCFTVLYHIQVLFINAYFFKKVNLCFFLLFNLYKTLKQLTLNSGLLLRLMEAFRLQGMGQYITSSCISVR
jgi:hypothetical protein